MVGGTALLRHRQNPRNRLTSPTDDQLALCSDQLGQLTESGAHLTNVELFHRYRSLCCNFSRCSTMGLPRVDEQELSSTVSCSTMHYVRMVRT